MNFPLILFVLLLLTGSIWLLDIFFLKNDVLLSKMNLGGWNIRKVSSLSF